LEVYLKLEELWKKVYIFKFQNMEENYIRVLQFFCKRNLLFVLKKICIENFYIFFALAYTTVHKVNFYEWKIMVWNTSGSIVSQKAAIFYTFSTQKELDPVLMYLINLHPIIFFILFFEISNRALIRYKSNVLILVSRVQPKQQTSHVVDL